MRDENDELPGDFLHELYKWALECERISIFVALARFYLGLLLSRRPRRARHQARLRQQGGQRGVEENH